MIEVWKKSELKRILAAREIHYSKAYGQNFLVDKNTLEKIADAAEITPDDHVVEIGPGAGALTLFLAARAGLVTAVEIDKRLIPVLAEVTEGLTNIDIVCADFLKYELPSAEYGVEAGVEAGAESGKYKLVGNLPYYITTPIIAKVCEPSLRATRSNPVELAVFMMQKEVAERLLSPPGKKTYGAISVLVQYYTEAELLFEVSSEVFVPKPGVDSAVVRLRLKDLSADDPAVAARMFKLVRAGFDKRRKTLRNSLADSGFPEKDLLAALESAGIDPVRRAETLSPGDFYKVASFLLEK